MEIGKVYVINNKYKGKTIYRLEQYKLELESYYVGYFWYANKFGEGYVYKRENEMRNMVLAPESYQVLFGQAKP